MAERVGPTNVNMEEYDFPNQFGGVSSKELPWGEQVPAMQAGQPVIYTSPELEPLYELRFKLQDQLAKPIQNVPYKTFVSGSITNRERLSIAHIADGETDEDGLTNIVSTKEGESIDFYIVWAAVNKGKAKYTPKKALTQKEINNMTAFDVVEYWALGDGGELYFGPESHLSKEFSEGDGAKLLEELFYKKFDGNPPNLGSMNRVDYKYTWFFRAWNSNPSVQIIGTWKGHAVRVDDQVLFRASNSMTFNSLTFGRQRAETEWEWLNPDALGPKENDLDMLIEWTRPLRAN